jgi:hypothetical protein
MTFWQARSAALGSNWMQDFQGLGVIAKKMNIECQCWITNAELGNPAGL